MPKMKTNRSAAKRFKATASGKLKHKKAYARHNLGLQKSNKQKRNLRKGDYLETGDARRMRALTPYA